MLRLNPVGYYRFVQASQFESSYAGGEANVAVSLANYGMSAAFVTKVPEHEIGQCAVNAMRQFGVDTTYMYRGGSRLGVYYAEKGASQRPSKVIYDRAGSSITTAKPEEFPWDEIFRDADWFHFTGITPALGGDAAVYGDFFSTLDADTLCAALLGCPYERGAVLEALQSHGIDGAVYRISAEELASVVVD